MADLSDCESPTLTHIFPPVLNRILYKPKFSKVSSFIIGISIHVGLESLAVASMEEFQGSHSSFVFIVKEWCAHILYLQT